jgi:two-component system chemotaxis sensor kinase CheA
VVIRALETETHHVIEVEDDGAGIDFAALERGAKERGIAARGIDLLFCDGLSTAAEVTDVSGRGVGMGAARAACESLGGTVFVETKRGRGSKFRFAVPMRTLAQGSLPPVRLSPRGATRSYKFA